MGSLFPHVHSDQGLDLALERMGANQIEILPVVSRADIHKLEGIVTLRDVWIPTVSALQTVRRPMGGFLPFYKRPGVNRSARRSRELATKSCGIPLAAMPLPCQRKGRFSSPAQ